MHSESELLALSGLQHLRYCSRQWALIHLEEVWTENRWTAEGRVLHEKVHTSDAESRGKVKIVRGLKIRSLRLGLSGVADVVELHADPAGVAVPGMKGTWRVFPVEYKRGKPKRDRCDEVQVCAQALCLEEMLGARIESAALFYGQTRHRMDVLIGDDLRSETEALAGEMHALYAAGVTPAVEYVKKKCDRCSLVGQCMPKSAKRSRKVERYLAQAWDI